jgi:uncharacterized membrane protein
LDHHHQGQTNDNESRLVDRLMFFTDAVFAIVLTLLILELRPPEERFSTNGELMSALHHVVPYVAAFAGSFALVGIFWFAHLQITRNMGNFDWPVAIANLIFLFVIAFMPFTTALAATQGWLLFTFQLYAVNMVAASLAQVILFTLLTRDGGRIVGSISNKERAYRLFRAAVPGITFGAVLAFTVTPWVDLWYIPIFLMPILFFVAHLMRPKVGEAKAEA